MKEAANCMTVPTETDALVPIWIQSESSQNIKSSSRSSQIGRGCQLISPHAIPWLKGAKGISTPKRAKTQDKIMTQRNSLQKQELSASRTL